MVNWLKNASDAVAFRLAWMKRKSAEKKQRWKELLERYPAEALEKEIGDRERQITERVRSKYKAKKKSYDDAIRVVVDRQSELKRVRKILTRDYEQELQSCYERKEQIKRRHVSIKSELSDAYRRLKDAKADVDAWHRKSKRSGLLFGNSGKKIPQHSLFGQSYGDLDAAKARRNEAGGDIGDLKSEKERISAEFTELDVKIQRIRDGQRERRELMTQGYTYTSVEVENAQLSKEFSQLAMRSKAAKRRGERVLQQELARNFVSNDRERAAQMRENRKAELAAFMADDQVVQRRGAFRNDWERSRANVA